MFEHEYFALCTNDTISVDQISCATYINKGFKSVWPRRANQSHQETTHYAYHTYLMLTNGEVVARQSVTSGNHPLCLSYIINGHNRNPLVMYVRNNSEAAARQSVTSRNHPLCLLYIINGHHWKQLIMYVRHN